MINVYIFLNNYSIIQYNNKFRYEQLNLLLLYYIKTFSLHFTLLN